MSQTKSEFALALNQICAERGIDPKVVIESIKQALLAALKRDLGLSDEEALVGYVVNINEETGAIEVLKDGKDATPAGFGRIAAQVAKQVIMQRVREAEKDAILGEYEAKIGTMVTGMILRFDGPNVVVDIVRVQAVINELNGEKVDIIEYSKDLKAYIASALAPAEGLNVVIDDKLRKATITIPDDQLSLAIGKGGQNARLAAKLTGYKIDIKGAEASKIALSTSGDEQFEIDALGLSSKLRNTLIDMGITTVKELEAKIDEVKVVFAELDVRGPEETEKAILRFHKKQNMAKEELEKMARYQAERDAELK